MPPKKQNSTPQPTEPVTQDVSKSTGDTEPSTQSVQPAYQPPINSEKMRVDNMSQTAPYEPNIKNEYYIKGSRKVIDFLIGFFVPGIIIYILGIVAPILFTFFYIVIIAVIILIIAFFMIGRRYIAIGMIISCVVIPLIVFGSCLLILANMHL